jgi:hypothetical protein
MRLHTTYGKERILMRKTRFKDVGDVYRNSAKLV